MVHTFIHHLLSLPRISVVALAIGCGVGPAPAPAPLAVPPTPVAESETRDFEGVWDSSYGEMRLTRDGTIFRGVYAHANGAAVEGTLENDVLRGEYVEPAGDGPPVRGRFAFRLAANGESFGGTWCEGAGAPLDPDDATLARWEGTRVRIDTDRIWFVVLEENWEESLREPEFSYGEMLRAFFARVAHVGVRHRFVHDRADLERFCAEVARLPGPVVLYVSSHGSPEGLGIGAEGVAPDVLGAAIRDVPDLRLLHLGACAVLAGDAPQRIRAAAGKSFPISGFVESVDWAASAIVDFTYMQLVLEQGLAPADAVAATRRMLSFAKEPGDTGALPGCDLVVSEAPSP